MRIGKRKLPSLTGRQVRIGSAGELKDWLDRNVQKVRTKYETGLVFSWLGNECPERQVESNWKERSLNKLTGLLCAVIDVEKRLEVANLQEQVNFFYQAPSHPMHVLYKDLKLEQKVSEVFRATFKTDIVLNRGAGKVIGFHVGNKPEMSVGEDSLSPSYFSRLCKLPFLHNQGHGMRSFVGCVLHVFTSPAFIHLLDEPEAFLHPPHSRLLGALLARSIPNNRQLFVATHSGDFLRGLLDTNPVGLRIIRLTRDGSVNHVHELDGNSIRTLWADPVLRFSNVLDAIFHDGAVICESDSDCRFYSAMMNAVLEARGEVPQDVMFAASGGKDRLPTIINALAKLGVKIRVIADFDVLRDENTLSGIIVALGGKWDRAEAACRNLKANIHSQTPPLSLNQVREQIAKALDKETGASVSNQTVENVKQTLKATSPWHYAKLAGVNAIASGQPRQQLEELLQYLRSLGLYVVECGEVERFVPSVGAHGPKWVAQVLTKDLASDAELESARAFILRVFGAGPQEAWLRPTSSPEPKAEPILASDTETTSKRSFWVSLLKRIGINTGD